MTQKHTKMLISGAFGNWSDFLPKDCKSWPANNLEAEKNLAVVLNLMGWVRKPETRLFFMPKKEF